MEVRCFTGGDFAQNGYVAWCEATGQCVIVDPGAVALDMVAAVKARAGEVTAVLLTHAHFDHVEGLGVIRDYTDAPTYLHPADRVMFDNLPAQAAMLGLSISSPQLNPPERGLVDGDAFHFGECVFKIIHTPGHSPGHVILHAIDDVLALVGDLIFSGSIGRTDLPGGDYQALFQSIRQHVLTMPGETQLFTGHGPDTTVERERTTNPFLVPSYGGELA
jgi:hydroxyacylglutathione hydrolase